MGVVKREFKLGDIITPSGESLTNAGAVLKDLLYAEVVLIEGSGPFYQDSMKVRIIEGSVHRLDRFGYTTDFRKENDFITVFCNSGFKVVSNYTKMDNYEIW